MQGDGQKSSSSATKNADQPRNAGDRNDQTGKKSTARSGDPRAATRKDQTEPDNSRPEDGKPSGAADADPRNKVPADERLKRIPRSQGSPFRRDPPPARMKT